jgi:hypothetical protein
MMLLRKLAFPFNTRRALNVHLVLFPFTFQFELIQRGLERIEQAGKLQVLEPRQVSAGGQTEMGEEARRGRISERPPGASRRPAGRTQPASISTSSVPRLIWTPRIASISARLTGS